MTVNATFFPSLACGLLLTGCVTSQPPPTGLISQAEVAMMQAAASGAMEIDPLSMRLAREKMDAADQAMAGKDYLSARRFAEQALVDAQTAEAHAMNHTAKKSAAEIRISIDLLRQELEQPRHKTQ